MKTRFYLLSSIGFLFFFASNAFSQNEIDSTQQVVVAMESGVVYTGVIISQYDEKVLLKTANGELSLLAYNIVSITDIIHKDAHVFANPSANRYFLGQSALPIKTGTGYFQNIMFTVNSISYGITDNLSIRGGFEFISTIRGQPFWFISPKISFELVKNFHVAGGVLMANIAFEERAYFPYGSFTYGNTETNVSLNISTGYSSGELIEKPLWSFSATHRLSEKLAFLTENHFIPEDININNHPYLGIQGFRVLSEKSTYDFGIIIIPEAFENIPGLPYFSYVKFF